MESDNILNLLNNLGKTKIWIKLGCCPIPLSGDIDLSIKDHHNKHRPKQAAGLIESGCTQKICDCDVVIPMKNISEITGRLESSVIKNIWEVRVI